MRLIHEDIALIVGKMRETRGDNFPFYIYGKPKYINNRLVAMNNDKTKQGIKYPVLGLFFDIDEPTGTEPLNLNLFIATNSKLEYLIEDRMEINFKPTLIPLYELFLVKLRDSGLFRWKDSDDNGFPVHTRSLRPYWGKAGLDEDEKTAMADVLDAIEIEGLEIYQTNKTC